MKQMFKKMVWGVMALTGILISSCSKDGGSSNEPSLQNKSTEVAIYVKGEDGSVVSGMTVYAYTEALWRGDDTNASSTYFKKAETDANGKATFVIDGKELTTRSANYVFAVYYTNSSGTLRGRSSLKLTVVKGENQQDEIILRGVGTNNGSNSGNNQGNNNSGNNNSGNNQGTNNGSNNSGNNNSGSNNNGNNNGTNVGGNSGTVVRQPAEIDIIVKDNEGNPLSGATVVVGGVTKTTNAQGIAAGYNAETRSTYEWKVTTQCGETKSGRLSTGDRDLEYTINTFKAEKGTIVLTNESSNPYTITIGNQQWVIQGKATKNLTAFYNTSYTVKWKQNSGYLIYPTTGEKTVKLSCTQGTVAVTFPD